MRLKLKVRVSLDGSWYMANCCFCVYFFCQTVRPLGYTISFVEIPTHQFIKIYIIHTFMNLDRVLLSIAFFSFISQRMKLPVGLDCEIVHFLVREVIIRVLGPFLLLRFFCASVGAKVRLGTNRGSILLTFDGHYDGRGLGTWRRGCICTCFASVSLIHLLDV